MRKLYVCFIQFLFVSVFCFCTVWLFGQTAIFVSPSGNDSKHEDADLCHAELPVCSVYGQPVRAFHGENVMYDTGNEIREECIFRKNRWILRKHESAIAEESKQVAKRLKHIVLTLHKAFIKSKMSLI